MSLTWNYTLTVGEQTASQTFFKVTWRKFNPGTSSFDEFASYVKFTGSNPTFSEPNAPRIVVDRSIGNSSAYYNSRISGWKMQEFTRLRFL